MRGVAVVVLAPALGEHVFLLRLQHREPLDFGEIAGKAGFAGDDGKCGGHKVLLSGAGFKAGLRRA